MPQRLIISRKENAKPLGSLDQEFVIMFAP